MCKPWEEYYKKWKSMKPWTNIFCLVSLANYVTLFVLAVYPLVESLLSPDPFDTRAYIVTRTATFVAITIFQVIHAWFGLFHDIIYEIYANLVSQIVITVVIVIRCVVSASSWDVYLYVLFSYAVLFLALYIVFLYLIHEEYSYTFYQKAGADPVFRSMYSRYLRFQSVLKIDFMLAIVSCMSFLTADPNTSPTFLMTFNLIIAIIAAIYFYIGRFGVSHEIHPLILVFWGMSSIQPVFYCYGVWVYVNHSFWELSGVAAEVPFLFLSSAIAGIGVRLTLVVFCVLAYLNFDRGLRDFEFLKKKTSQESGSFTYSKVQPNVMTVNDVIKHTQAAQRHDVYIETDED